MKQKIKNKEILLGTWLTLYNNNVVEIIARSGFDWLAVDLEHSSIDLYQAENMIRIIDLCNCYSFVRLPSVNQDIIKKIMDIGVKGLIVPNVINISDVNQVIEYANYPPKGKRGVGLARANMHGDEFDKYYQWQNDELIIIPQIENINAIQNLEEIFTSGKIDAYFIGPYDLSASMNIPGQFNNKDFIDAVNEIKNIANKHNISHGIHVIDPDIQEIQKKIKENYSFIACSLDTLMINDKCKEIVKIKNCK